MFRKKIKIRNLKSIRIQDIYKILPAVEHTDSIPFTFIRPLTANPITDYASFKCVYP